MYVHVSNHVVIVQASILSFFTVVASEAVIVLVAFVLLATTLAIMDVIINVRCNCIELTFMDWTIRIDLPTSLVTDFTNTHVLPLKYMYVSYLN